MDELLQPPVEEIVKIQDGGRNECLHFLIEALSQKTPQVVALIQNDKQWTYEDLNRLEILREPHVRGVAHHVIQTLEVG